MTNSPAGIGSKVVSGTLWTVGMRVGTRALGLISTLILARILVPEDFGLVAKAAVLYELLSLATALGLESALITFQDARKDHYNTVWTIHLLRGLAIALLLVVLSNAAATWFEDPRLEFIVPCYALAALVEGLTNVGVVDFRKYLDFRRDFLFELHKKLAGFLAAMAIAYLFRSYWAFIAGMLAGAFSGVASSYWLSKFRPRPTLSRWRDFTHFGSRILTAELVGALSTKLDVILLSRFAATEKLGLYTVSQELAATPSTEIAMPVARALMPGLAKLNRDPQAFRTLYMSTLSLVLTLALPAAIGLVALSSSIVAVLLGPNWAAAAPLVEALAIFGVSRVVAAVSTSAYLAFDRAGTLMRLALLNLSLRAALLPLGLVFGDVGGLAWAIALAGLIGAITSLTVQHRVRMLDAPTLWRYLWRMCASAALMFVMVGWARVALEATSWGSPLVVLVAASLFGVVAFFGSLLVLWKATGGSPGPEALLLQYLRARFR